MQMKRKELEVGRAFYCAFESILGDIYGDEVSGFSNGLD